MRFPDASLRRFARPHGRAIVLALLVGATLLSTGCMRRRLTVRSNPPGAMVYVDNQRIGTTPCSVDYVYYGTREVRLELQGYETLSVNQPLPAPWWQWPGIDFFSDNLALRKIEDARSLSYNLQPQRMAPIEEVIARGEELRRAASPTGVAPAAAAIPGPQAGVVLPAAP